MTTTPDAAASATSSPDPALAPRLDLVEDLHGHAVADPYRRLEDRDDPATGDWSLAQDGLAAAYLSALPGRDALAARLRALLDVGSVEPRRCGGATGRSGCGAARVRSTRC